MTGAPVPAAPAAPVPTPKAPSLLARLSSLWATLAALEAKYAPATFTARRACLARARGTASPMPR